LGAKVYALKYPHLLPPNQKRHFWRKPLCRMEGESKQLHQKFQHGTVVAINFILFGLCSVSQNPGAWLAVAICRGVQMYLHHKPEIKSNSRPTEKT